MTLLNFYHKSLGDKGFAKKFTDFELIEVYQEFRQLRSLSRFINQIPEFFLLKVIE